MLCGWAKIPGGAAGVVPGGPTGVTLGEATGVMLGDAPLGKPAHKKQYSLPNLDRHGFLQY